MDERERTELVNKLDHESNTFRLSTAIASGRYEDNFFEKFAHGNVITPPKKEIVVLLEGAFDMMHYGHMNAFRQAKSLGS